MFRFLPPVLLLLFSFSLTACFDHPGELRGVSDRRALPLPSKDEVALVNGRPLSISGYLAIREAIGPKVPSEMAFWIASAALCIQNETAAQGREVAPQTALDIARYAAGVLPEGTGETSFQDYFQGSKIPPSSEKVRISLDSLIKRSIIQRNTQALAEVESSVTKR